MFKSVLLDIWRGAKVIAAALYALFTMLVIVGAILFLFYLIVYPDGGDVEFRTGVGFLIIVYLCWYMGREKR